MAGIEGRINALERARARPLPLYVLTFTEFMAVYEGSVLLSWIDTEL